MGNSGLFPGLTIVELEVRDRRELPDGKKKQRSFIVNNPSIQKLPLLARRDDIDALRYRLHIKATTSVGADSRARAFVRFKNPFEPNLIQLQNNGIINPEGVLKTYEVIAEVTK